MYTLPFQNKIILPISIEKIFTLVFLVLVFSFFLINLIRLQILEGEINLAQSIKNANEEEIILAPRGKIYSSDLKILAFDEKIYEVGFLDTIEDEKEIPCLGSKSQSIENKKYLISDEEMKECQEDGVEFDFVDEKYKRVYLDSEVFSNVIGYVGFPNEEEIKFDGIHNLSRIGRTGLEKYYDSYLKGVEGKKLEVSRFDGSVDSFIVSSPVAGNDLYTSIDSRWQTLLYRELQKLHEKGGGIGGSAVVVNAKTGEIKALVSFPGYDSNMFVNGITQEEYNSLLGDVRTPLLNKAISLQASPGSAFKPIIAIIALDLGLIDPDDYYESKGCEFIDPEIEFCEADRKVLGNVNLYTAISRSSNLYFCHLARTFDNTFGSGVGVQYLLEGTDKFFVGKETGIDLFGEESGSMSTPEYIQKTQNRSWSVGDMCNTAIGQGDVLVTPLQMSNFISSIKNGGLILRPFIVDEILDSSGQKVFKNILNINNDLLVSSDVLEKVEKGMRNTVLDEKGSGRLLRSENGNIILKTGSADTSEVLTDGSLRTGAHSWVVGVFEYESELYSFAVIDQFGGRGYQTVPVVGNLVSCIYDNFSDDCIKY